MYCPNHRLLISWLDNSLKNAVSEHAVTFNMWKRRKYLRNLHESSFILFFSSFSRKLIWKMSHLLSDEILKVFVYILTGDGQYPVQGFIEFATPNWNAIIWKRKNFSSIFFFLHFWNLHHILNILKEKLIVIVNVFPKLQNVRIFVRKLSKEHRLRRGFGSQHVKESQMVGKSPWESFDEVFLSFSVRLIWKMPPLVFGEVLGMFVNKLTPDGKYPVEGCEDLQLQLKCNYLKNKTFFPNFCSISGVYIKFWIFWKQYDCHS